MPITKPTSLASWAAGASVVEPSTGKKSTGWLPSERPAAGMLNWIFRHLSEWIRWVYVGSARTLPWQATFQLSGAQGVHRSLAVLQSLSNAAVMLLGSFSGTVQIKTCNPVTGAWSNTTLAGGVATSFFSGGALAANASRFVLVGQGARIQTYENGVWTARSAAPGFAGNFTQVLWTGAQFVATDGLLELQTSPDGITWTRRASGSPPGAPVPVTKFGVIANGGSRLVRGGGNANGYAVLYYSDDGGTTWVHAFTSPNQQGNVARLVGTLTLDGSPIFAAYYDDPELLFLSSSGGISWQELPRLHPSITVALAVFNDLLLMSWKFASADGVTWNMLPFIGVAGTDLVAVSPQGWAVMSNGDQILCTPLQRYF